MINLEVSKKDKKTPYYAGLLSAKYLSSREEADARNAILVHVKGGFPQKDTRGAYLKEMNLGQEKLSTLIETRSGALRNDLTVKLEVSVNLIIIFNLMYVSFE